MSLGTALVALVGVMALRRALPPDDRQQGVATAMLLSLAILLGTFRLLIATVGASFSTTGRVVTVLTTFFVALGAVNAVILLVFEVIPARTKLRLPVILRDLVQMLAFVVILFGSLSQSGLANFISLVTTSAVLTAVVGLALQSTMANLFAGIVLHMDRALGVGDWVQLGARVGRISQIRWRSTILRTTDGDNVIIPNSQFTSTEVYNYSRPSSRHRIWLRVSFAYRHPPNEIRQVLIAAVRGAPGVLAEPAVDCFPVDFGESGVVYAVRYWINDFSRRAEVEGEVRTRIWYAARRAGLEIPFPIRVMHNVGHHTGLDLPVVIDETELRERMSALARVDLLNTLDSADREVLARRLRKEQFAAGEPILRQGEAGDSLFIIASGDVVVSIGAAGIDQSITTLGVGSFFGEMSLVTGEPRSATCSARTDVVCYVIDHPAFQQILSSRPQLAEHLSSLLAHRQAALTEKGGELNARAVQAAEHRKKLLARIRSFFDLD
jgi:small-conductance mechanosensitive channel/CRP-like cAMP-binding protein